MPCLTQLFRSASTLPSPLILSSHSPQDLYQGGEWTSTAPSRWTAPPTCQLHWLLLPWWSLPPLPRLAEMPLSPARHPGPSAFLSPWRRTSTSHSLRPPIPSPPCISVRVPCRAPFHPVTSQLPCSTCTPSSPHQTWTAPPWACSTTAGWVPSDLSPPHKRRGSRRVTSRRSPLPKDWKAASRRWRGRSTTLAPWEAPSKLGRTRGGSCSPCPACCLMEKLHRARRSAKSTVSNHLSHRHKELTRVRVWRHARGSLLTSPSHTRVSCIVFNWDIKDLTHPDMTRQMIFTYPLQRLWLNMTNWKEPLWAEGMWKYFSLCVRVFNVWLGKVFTATGCDSLWHR